MLGNCWLCKADFINNIIADTGLLTADVLQYGYARRVGQYLKDYGQFILLGIEYLCFGNTHCHIYILQYYDDKMKQKSQK